MTRKLLTILLPLFFIAFTTNVNAQTIATKSSQANTSTSTAAAPQVPPEQQKRITATAKLREETKAKALERRAQFKTQLQKIKDQRKKALAERIDTKLAEINKKQTTKYLEVLTKLQTFLDKIKQSTTDQKVLANITIAQTAIDGAKAAIKIQEAKIYTMEITDDTTLKTNAGAALSLLREDLTIAHDLIVNAKQAMQELNTDRVIIKKESTTSAR